MTHDKLACLLDRFEKLTRESLSLLDKVSTMSSIARLEAAHAEIKKISAQCIELYDQITSNYENCSEQQKDRFDRVLLIFQEINQQNRWR